MTKQEFIARYGAKSEWKTDFGMAFGNRKYFALPCACGEDGCRGWAMVSDELVDSHMELYAPARLEAG